MQVVVNDKINKLSSDFNKDANDFIDNIYKSKINLVNIISNIDDEKIINIFKLTKSNFITIIEEIFCFNHYPILYGRVAQGRVRRRLRKQETDGRVPL